MTTISRRKRFDEDLPDNPWYWEPGTTIYHSYQQHQRALKVLGNEEFNANYFVLCKLSDCFASRPTEIGTDMVTLSELLGHGDLKILKSYAQPSFEHMVETINRVESSGAKAV